MATENLKSALITNATATPLVLSNSSSAKGLLLESCGTITPLAAADVASTYRFARVPSNARISQILVYNAAFSAGAVDIGIYQTADNGGAVASQTFFAAAYSLASARANADVTYTSGTFTAVKSEQPLWQALGLSVDSNREYDIAYTVSTQFSVGVAMHLKVRYAV